MSAIGTINKRAHRDPRARESSRERTASRGVGTTRGVMALSALSLLASVVNYGSNLAFARVLTPASYGDLTSLLALSVVVAVPLTAAQTRIATRVAALRSRIAGARSLRRPPRDGSSDRDRDWRHARSTSPRFRSSSTSFICRRSARRSRWAALVFVGFLFPTLQGVLQGLERWVAFGLVGLAVALSRVVFGLPWAAAGGGAGGAIAGQAIGMLVCLAGAVLAVRDHVRSHGQAAPGPAPGRAPAFRGSRPAQPSCSSR